MILIKNKIKKRKKENFLDVVIVEEKPRSQQGHIRRKIKVYLMTE
jgi:hypothetical protein